MSPGPLRVLHVTPYYEPAYVYGGPTYSVPLLCKSLAHLGLSVTVITTDANGDTALDVPRATPIERDGVTVLYFPRVAPRSTFRSPSLGEACNAFARTHDIVHVTGVWTYPSWAATRSSYRAGTPYIVSPRGMLMDWERRHKAWKKWPYFRFSEYPRLKRSGGIHCTAPEELRAMAELGLEAQSFLVPNPLDLDALRVMPERGLFRARYGIGTDEALLLFLGRLHPKKGIDLTLRAFERLAAEHGDVHLALVGPDEHNYTRTIPDWARRHGLSARIHLTGEIYGDDRLSAYADADIFLLLSASENFGMSAAEASAASVPVVVTEGVGIGHWIRERAAGLVVSHDVESVTAAVESLLRDPSACRAMGANGRALADQAFSPRGVASSMIEHYNRVRLSSGG